MIRFIPHRGVTRAKGLVDAAIFTLRMSPPVTAGGGTFAVAEAGPVPTVDQCTLILGVAVPGCKWIEVTGRGVGWEMFMESV